MLSRLSKSPLGNQLDLPSIYLLGISWQWYQVQCSFPATRLHASHLFPLGGKGPPTSQWNRPWWVFLIWAHGAPSLPNSSCWLCGTTLLHCLPIGSTCRFLVLLVSSGLVRRGRLLDPLVEKGLCWLCPASWRGLHAGWPSTRPTSWPTILWTSPLTHHILLGHWKFLPSLNMTR